ncbi:DNA-processing protein DprA [Oceanotoga sp. DSM 15011]|uniref:DNA-processing protein DprA n=1 Tax=Oceanotoga sp. DSM 15011 TaxID=2984951 RepID=UPI0021F49276|nr:DNA-processing protein DprA [Oceanotoga sp. DSM 15011]UYP00878.1 DNA-processing protein DprA [Oceanotoga sp. DSM 15011]
MDTLDLITLRECFKKSNEEIIKIYQGQENAPVFKEDYNSKKLNIYNHLKKYKDIKIINFWDSDYPKNLKIIKDPPVILYYKGDISLIKTKTVSIVGTRKPTAYGIKTTEEFCEILSDYTTVSGMAYGIDSAVHKNSKNTIAVLGNGVDSAYPKGNQKLYEKLCDENLVISEFIPGSTPFKHTFPYRNRIIAGFSDKTIVIEAAKKSGSLITARYALEFGRDVLAVPGDITRVNSYGTNYLIYSGATPIISKKILKEIFNISISGEKLNTNNSLENQLIDLIKNNINTVDLICNKLNEDVSIVLSTLMNLEIKSIISQESGVYFLL